MKHKLFRNAAIPVASVLGGYLTTLLPVVDDAKVEVGLAIAVAIVIFLLLYLGSRRLQPTPGPKIQRLMAISKISTPGKKLLEELKDIIQLSDEQYRIRRQAVIDWATECSRQLSELSRDEAAMFGNPQEAEALDDYAKASRGNIPLTPLIDFVQERLDRLEQMRRDLGTTQFHASFRTVEVRKGKPQR